MVKIIGNQKIEFLRVNNSLATLFLLNSSNIMLVSYSALKFHYCYKILYKLYAKAKVGMTFSSSFVDVEYDQNYDYVNYVTNVPNSKILIPTYERWLCEYCDEIDPDVMYHAMFDYREKAKRLEFPDSDSKSYYEHIVKVKMPDKLREVAEFFKVTEQIEFLWEDCLDIMTDC